MRAVPILMWSSAAVALTLMATVTADASGATPCCEYTTTTTYAPPTTTTYAPPTTTTYAPPPTTTYAPPTTTYAPPTTTTYAPPTTPCCDYTTTPYSSQPAEVTTAAPTPAPTGDCGYVYIDAQFVLSGVSWSNVQATAQATARASDVEDALVSDLAALLGRREADVSIVSTAVGADGLTVAFTARSNALAEAARIAALIRDDVPATAPLPATLALYLEFGQTSNNDVRVTSHTATSRDAFDSTCAGSSNGNEVTTAAPCCDYTTTTTTYAPPTTATTYAPPTTTETCAPPTTTTTYAPPTTTTTTYAPPTTTTTTTYAPPTTTYAPPTTTTYAPPPAWGRGKDVAAHAASLGDVVSAAGSEHSAASSWQLAWVVVALVTFSAVHAAL